MKRPIYLDIPDDQMNWPGPTRRARTELLKRDLSAIGQWISKQVANLLKKSKDTHNGR